MFGNEVNDPPTNIQLSNIEVIFESPVGTIIGTLNATDPDLNASLTFYLDVGEGDQDN